MKTCLTFFAAVLCVSGCMRGPAHNEVLGSRLPPLEFYGYVDGANLAVNIQAFDAVAGQWKTFATTTSSTNGITDGTGKTGYYYEIDVSPPRAARFWPTSSSGSARFRAVDGNGDRLFTGDAALWSCC